MCVSKENAELLEGDLGEKKKGGDAGGQQMRTLLQKGLSAEIKEVKF